MKTTSLALIALAACTEPMIEEQTAPLFAAEAIPVEEEETEETASCPAGETLVAGSATCKYTLNAATASGSHTTWYIYPNPGDCLCYLDADCKFNDKSDVCAGGSLAIDETYPCTDELTDTSWKYLTRFTNTSDASCKTKCTEYYDALTVTQKNNFARDACELRVPASHEVKPISCCMAD